MSAGTASHVFSLHCRTQRFNIRKILVNNGVPEEAADLIVEKFLQTQHEWSEDDNPGYIPNVVAGRIANRFDLGGTSCSVDAACGASLGAVKFAVDELVSGNMDVMLCGGANLDNSPVSEILYPKALTAEEWTKAQNAIHLTANTQPVLAAAEAGLYAIVNRRGLKADTFIGHSFGELVALWADGAMDYETLISIAKVRGTLMSKSDPDVAMAACMTDKATLTEVCKTIPNVYIANENSASQTVVPHLSRRYGVR